MILVKRLDGSVSSDYNNGSVCSDCNDDGGSDSSVYGVSNDGRHCCYCNHSAITKTPFTTITAITRDTVITGDTADTYLPLSLLLSLETLLSLPSLKTLPLLPSLETLEHYRVNFKDSSVMLKVVVSFITCKK